MGQVRRLREKSRQSKRNLKRVVVKGGITMGIC